MAVLVVYTRDEQRHWVPAGQPPWGQTYWTLILLLLTWWFLIVRAVQSEALPGDRQYWITRPYEWKKLLAAKLLFIGVFVHLAAFVDDAFLLTRAGFNLHFSRNV